VRAIGGAGVLLAFPWLFVSFGLYNAIAFAKGNPASPQEPFNETLASFEMLSGAVWQVSTGDVLIALTLMFLFIESLRATVDKPLSTLDRMLSLVLFVLCLVEFTVRREAATSVFFLITLMTFVDVVGGLWLHVRAARRR
jgi:hypothetical protein